MSTPWCRGEWIKARVGRAVGLFLCEARRSVPVAALKVLRGKE
jgi:hypothetical protein